MDIYMKTNGTWGIISMENGGQLGIEKMPKLMISFTVAGTAYQAELGMTWGEWVESSYNTNTAYVIENNYIRTNGTNTYVSTGGNGSTYVTVTEIITPNYSYGTSK